MFLILAQKAPSLGRNTTLAGWLFRTARLTSKDALRREQRRRWREHTSAQAEARNIWPEARPHPRETLLNEALATLKPGEREAILLRFVEEASFREVGETLGLSEDTAQKRVSRTLEKMRAYFARNQEVLSAAAFLGVLAAEAARDVPAGCARPLMQIVPGLKISVVDSGLLGTRAYQISQGVLRTMKAKAMLTAAGVSVLAIASVSMLMAGVDKIGGSIVGPWAGKIVAYVYVSKSPMKPGQQSTGPMKRTQKTDTVDSTWQFNSDGTFRSWAVNTTWTGKYRLTGSSLTIYALQQFVRGERETTTTYPANQPPQTFVTTFSNGGKMLTLTDTHIGWNSVVLRRQ